MNSEGLVKEVKMGRKQVKLRMINRLLTRTKDR